MAITNAGGGSYTLNDASSQLLGPQLTDAANNLYASGATPGDVRSGVNSIYQAASASQTLLSNANATAIEDQGQSAAQAINAQGDQLEAQQYLQAAGAADTNARLARASGAIQQYQEGRTVARTMGTQQADITAAGFTSANHPGSGSAFWLAANSAQQGALAKQLIGANADITARGYEQQSDAAQAEATGASTAGDAASALSASAANSAAALQQNAASQGAMLTANALNNAMSLVDQANGDPAGTIGGTSGTAGSGSGSKSLGDTTSGYDIPYTAKDGTPLIGHVSPAEAAADSDMLHDGQNAVQITDIGKQAAAAYEADMRSGQRAAHTGTGGLRVTQDKASAAISTSGLG